MSAASDARVASKEAMVALTARRRGSGYRTTVSGRGHSRVVTDVMHDA
jgi:hypothetical protein